MPRTTASSHAHDDGPVPTAATHPTATGDHTERSPSDDPAVWRLLELVAGPTSPASVNDLLRQVLVVTGADEVALYTGRRPPTLFAAHGSRIIAERQDLVDPRLGRALAGNQVVALGDAAAGWRVDPRTVVRRGLWVPAPADCPTPAVLRVLWVTGGVVDARLMALLCVVAHRLGTALWRLTRERLEQARGAERAQLFLVSASVATELDFAKVAQRVVEGLAAVTGYAAATVEVVEGATVRRAAAIGDDAVRVDVTSPLARWREALTDDHVIGERSYQVALRRSLPAHDDDRPSGTTAHGIVTELRDHTNDVVGFLTLSHPRTDIGPPPDVAPTVELFARQAELALRNAALYLDARRQRDLATTMTQVTSAISRSLDTAEILATCCAAAATHTGAERATMFLVDEQAVVRFGADDRQSDPAAVWTPRALRDCRLLAAATRATTPLVIDDLTRSARYADAAATRALGLRSVALVPLHAGGTTLGVLVVDSHTRPERLSDDNLAVLTQIATQAATALQLSVLHERTREQGGRNARLLELTTALTATLDLETIFGRIVDAVTARADVQAVSALRIGDDSVHLLGAMSNGQVWCPRPPPRLAIDGQVLQALAPVRHHGTLRIDDVRALPALSAICRPATRAALFAAPVGRSDADVLLAVSSREAGAFTSADERFLGDLAQVTRLAVRNADLFDEVAETARRDPLTGLHNRRMFWERLQHRLDVLSGPATVALAAVDADDFKLVNDRFGHTVGDAALLHIADRLTAGVRRSDEVYRIGGEEFTVVMPDATARDAYRVMRRAMRNVRDRGVGLPDLSVSVGVAVAPHDGRTADALFGEADRALLNAKRHGKDRVELRRDVA